MKRNIVREIKEFIKISPKTTVRDACLLLGIDLEDYKRELQKEVGDNELFNKMFGNFN